VAVVKERIAEGDVQSIVVASESGKTALAVAEALWRLSVCTEENVASYQY